MHRYLKKFQILSIVILCLICVACKTTKVITVPVDRVSTEYITKTDSIYVHDSVWSFIKETADTVFITNYKYKYKEIVRIDTLVKADTIPIVTTVEVPVTVNKMYWWQKALMIFGFIGMIFFFAYWFCIINFKMH